MNLVKHLLARKGNKMVSVAPHISVKEALRIMAENDIGSVVVIENGQLEGIMTERDYSRKIILMNRNSRDTSVGEIMTRNLPKVSPTDTIEYCMELMNANHIRYLPVFENEQLSGVVSISDLIKETVITQQRTIDQLEDYIRG